MKAKSTFAIAIILTAGLACSLFQRTATPTTASSGPPHQGVFIKTDGEYLELQEEGFTGGAVGSTQSVDYPVSPDARPTIVLWRSEAKFEYMQLFQGDMEGHLLITVEYDSVTKEEGVIEITPKSPLDTGIYCLIESDPFVELGTPQPGWCFKVLS